MELNRFIPRPLLPIPPPTFHTRRCNVTLLTSFESNLELAVGSILKGILKCICNIKFCTCANIYWFPWKRRSLNKYNFSCVIRSRWLYPFRAGKTGETHFVYHGNRRGRTIRNNWRLSIFCESVFDITEYK